jgi:hypothetical protein
LQASVVVVGGVGFVCTEDSKLLDERTARIEDVTKRTFEDTKLHAIEGDFESVANRTGYHGGWMKLLQESAGSLGVCRRKVKKCIPAARAFASGTTIDGVRSLYNIFSVDGDCRDERLRRVERK